MPLTVKSQKDSGNGYILDDDTASSLRLLTDLLAAEGYKVVPPAFRNAGFLQRVIGGWPLIAQ